MCSILNCSFHLHMYVYFPVYLLSAAERKQGAKPVTKCVISSPDLQENIVNFISFITLENFEKLQCCL